MSDLAENKLKRARAKSPLRDLVAAEIMQMDGLIKVYPLALQIGRLRNKSVAANSIYRIMSDLHNEGKVISVRSRNAFVSVPDGVKANLVIICSYCENVTLASVEPCAIALKARARKQSLGELSVIMEATGRCRDCQQNPCSD